VPYHPFLRLTVWTTAMSVIALSLPRALFLVREQAWRLTGLNLASFGVSTCLIIYFVVAKGEGAYGNLHGMFLGSLVVGLAALVVTLRNIAVAWRWSHIRQGLAFALPLLPHMLSLWILNLSDRWILQYYVSLTEIGVYSFGYLFGSIIQIIALSLSEAISPYYYRVASERADAAVVLTRLATYYIVIVIWAAVGLVAMAREVISLIAMRPEYHGATAVIPWVVLGCVARSFYFAFISAVYYSKKLSLLPVITIAAGLLNIGLNFLLVPLLGMIAAAITTFIAYVIQAVLIYLLAQRSFPLQYEYRRLTVITLLGLGWGGILCSFVLPNVWLSLTLKLALALTFPLALLAIRFFTTEEVGTARQLWGSLGHLKAQ
jgi:O-antigen/teichoic acid export membrane protein